MKHLEAKALNNHEKYEFIELTEAGICTASSISKNHKTIYSFLKNILEVEAETAEMEAFKIEHDLNVVKGNGRLALGHSYDYLYKFACIDSNIYLYYCCQVFYIEAQETVFKP
jgi:hypothetical protein